MKITKENIGKLLDLSSLQTDSSYEEIEEMVSIAKEYNCACVFTFPSHIPYVEKLLHHRRQDIHIGGVVGFPSGGNTTEMKVAETKELIEAGVDEIDMVQNVTWLKNGEYALIEHDIKSVVVAAKSKPVKVILECHYLTKDEIIRSCELAVKAGAAYVKTGTGWAETGATLENISLMVKTVKGKCQLKAAGGIKDKETIEKMTDLGVTRFGIGVRTARSILSECE